jgi:uncharacterized protein YcbK (DUF882 family)
MHEVGSSAARTDPASADQGDDVIERRNLLRMGLSLASAAGLSVVPSLANAFIRKDVQGTLAAHGPVASVHARRRHGKAGPPPRHLSFRHLHTEENLEVVYWEKGDYVPAALTAVNHLLRDFRTNEEHPIDLKLLDLLNALRQRTGTQEPFRIISGYRSPQTNEMLREQSAENHGSVPEVAKKSLHMEGQAIDIRLIDVALTRLHATAMSLKRGGVGFYPDSDFIHVDTGAVRYWQGS